MISKLIKDVNPSYLDQYTNRMSGDTLGKSLRIVGGLMTLNTPYEISIRGLEYNPKMDLRLLRQIQDVIDSMGLKHFVIDKKNMSVKYDIWK